MKKILLSSFVVCFTFVFFITGSVYAEVTEEPTITISTFTDSMTKITGKTEPEINVLVYKGDTVLAEGVSDEFGNFTIPLKKQKANSTLLIVAEDGETETYYEEKVQVYSSSLTVTKFTEWQTIISGKAAKNVTVEVSSGTKLLGKKMLKDTDSFSIKIPEQKKGKKLTVTTKTANGKTITKKSIIVAAPPLIGSGIVMGKYKSQSVEIVRDYGNAVYLIKFKNGKTLNVNRNQLYIPNDPKTNTKLLTKSELELIANKKLKSKTNYAIWLDISRQYTHVFKKDSTNKWKLHQSFLSATGKNVTPTVRGTYQIQFSKWGFYSGSYSKVHHATNFFGAYYFHSVILNKQGKIVDNTLGKRASHGCIRLAEKNAKYISTLPKGTTIWIP